MAIGFLSLLYLPVYWPKNRELCWHVMQGSSLGYLSSFIIEMEACNSLQMFNFSVELSKWNAAMQKEMPLL